MKNNSHVILFYTILCRKAAYEKRFMAQLHWYTLVQLEIDPNWEPDHLKYNS